jgi:hypothetical protein
MPRNLWWGLMQIYPIYVMYNSVIYCNICQYSYVTNAAVELRTENEIYGAPIWSLPNASGLIPSLIPSNNTRHQSLGFYTFPWMVFCFTHLLIYGLFHYKNLSSVFFFLILSNDEVLAVSCDQLKINIYINRFLHSVAYSFSIVNLMQGFQGIFLELIRHVSRGFKSDLSKLGSILETGRLLSVQWLTII